MSKGIIFACVVAVLLLSSCSSFQKNHQLPANWPIPVLTLPPGATLAFKVKKVPSDTTCGTQSLMASLDYYGSFQDVIKHVESCLRPLGYSEYWIENPAMDIRGEQRTFWSPDLQTEVMVLLGSSETNGRVSSSYILVINTFLTPPPKIKEDGSTTDTGITFHLDPLK